jgi:hypothetical protein
MSWQKHLDPPEDRRIANAFEERRFRHNDHFALEGLGKSPFPSSPYCTRPPWNHFDPLQLKAKGYPDRFLFPLGAICLGRNLFYLPIQVDAELTGDPDTFLG